MSNGKVILSGEHAVVYGKTALATQISLGVKVDIVENNGSEKSELVKKAIQVAGGNESIQVIIESQLPVGSGLGSSAAVAAATIKAVREHSGKPIDNNELYKLTMECEKLAHGNPSGLDPTTVIYGGLIAFRRGQPFERLNIPNPVKILLVNSGKPQETTKEMVEMVANNPRKIEIIEKIGGVSESVEKALCSGRDISQLLNENGKLLEELGVVGEVAKRISKEIREIGGSVKITGAGGVKAGSGMMIVLAPDYTNIKKMLNNKHIDYFEVKIGVQ